MAKLTSDSLRENINYMEIKKIAIYPAPKMGAFFCPLAWFPVLVLY